MTFEAHRSVQGPAAFADAAYLLTGIQSLAWHDRGPEGECVRREIRAAAKGRPIYDVDGKLLVSSASPSPLAPAR